MSEALCIPTLRPLSEPLRLAAEELAELAVMAEALQRTIVRVAKAGGTPDLQMMAELQAADLLSQRLAGMATFLNVIADSAPETAVADVDAAVLDLTLAEQARRLRGPRPADKYAPPEPEAHGEFQFFED